jgi:hypothetical protein
MIKDLLRSAFGFKTVAIVAGAALVAGGLAGGALGSRLQEAKSAKIQSAWDKEKAGRATAALGRVQAQSAVTADVGQKAAEAQVRIETRYRTLKEKVRVYVPTVTPPGVIRADDRVPVGALVLLDAAARGGGDDAVSVTTGKSYDLASPLRFTELVGGYVDNLGIGHATAGQLSDLQGWIRGQEALNKPPP